MFVATADGYLEKWRTDNHTRQWRIPIGDNHFVAPWDGPTGSPAVQTIKDAGGHPIAEASPAVAGAKTNTGDVPYVVFNTTASGGLKAWDAADSGTATAVVSVAANASGLGGVVRVSARSRPSAK